MKQNILRILLGQDNLFVNIFLLYVFSIITKSKSQTVDRINI